VDVTADEHADDHRRVDCADALEHGDEIRAAYWSGRSLDDLAQQWRASLKTIMTLAYSDGTGTVQESPCGESAS